MGVDWGDGVGMGRTGCCGVRGIEGPDGWDESRCRLLFRATTGGLWGGVRLPSPVRGIVFAPRGALVLDGVLALSWRIRRLPLDFGLGSSSSVELSSLLVASVGPRFGVQGRALLDAAGGSSGMGWCMSVDGDGLSASMLDGKPVNCSSWWRVAAGSAWKIWVRATKPVCFSSIAHALLSGSHRYMVPAVVIIRGPAGLFDLSML